MKSDWVEASYEMRSVTGIVDKDVFDLGGVSLLIISAYDGQVRYEILDETEREEWFATNTPCCGNKEHIGWGCDENGCCPF